jgi:hypothetical protein
MTPEPDIDRPSIEQLDPEVWERFLSVPANPALVSFPRTGSHWLRLLLELTCARPSLKRVFFYFASNDYLCWHTHDDDLTFRRERVIYLHRDPVDTVFSQLQYEGADLWNPATVRRCSDRYLAHLIKWLVHDDFTKAKLVLSYRDLKQDTEKSVREVVRFLHLSWEPARWTAARSLVTKDLVRRKTHESDEKVISTRTDYAETRSRFRELSSATIHRQIVGAEPKLGAVFE